MSDPYKRIDDARSAILDAVRKAVQPKDVNAVFAQIKPKLDEFHNAVVESVCRAHAATLAAVGAVVPPAPLPDPLPDPLPRKKGKR